MHYLKTEETRKTVDFINNLMMEIGKHKPKN